MKNLTFLFLISLVSCGMPEVQEENGTIIGSKWSISSADNNFSENEIEIINDICNDLDIKEAYIKNIVIPGNQSFNFSGSEYNCSGEKTDIEVTTKAEKKSSSDTYIFSLSDGLYSEDILARSSNDISELCEFVEEYQNTTLPSGVTKTLSRLNQSGTLAIVHSVSKDGACDGRYTLCLTITTGRLESNNQYETVKNLEYIIGNRSGKNDQGIIKKLLYETSLKCSEEDEVYRLEQNFTGFSI